MQHDWKQKRTLDAITRRGVYNLGIKAARAGFMLEDNPYVDFPPLLMVWRDGFFSVIRERAAQASARGLYGPRR